MTGADFRQIRMSLGLSQVELAEVLCLSGQVPISHIETEFRNPSKLTIAVMNILNQLPERRVKELISLLKEQSIKMKKKTPGGRNARN